MCEGRSDVRRALGCVKRGRMCEAEPACETGSDAEIGPGKRLNEYRICELWTSPVKRNTCWTNQAAGIEVAIRIGTWDSEQGLRARVTRRRR
jgi:hypothetical protein